MVMLFGFLLFVSMGGSMVSLAIQGASAGAVTTLNSTITSTATELSVADISGFKTANGFLVVDNEIMTYTNAHTAASGNCAAAGACFVLSSTAERGARGTLAAGHNANAKVYELTSGMLNQGAQSALQQVKTNNEDTFRINMDPRSWYSVIGIIISADFAFFQGDWSILAIPFYVFTAMLILALAAGTASFVRAILSS